MPIRHPEKEPQLSRSEENSDFGSQEGYILCYNGSGKTSALFFVASYTGENKRCKFSAFPEK